MSLPTLTLEKVLPPHLSESKASDSDYLHLQLRRGDTFVIFGPQGSGKGDFLSCLAGLKKPKAGKVTRLKGASSDNATSMVPRMPGLYEELEVWEYLQFFANLYELDSHYRQPLIASALSICELIGQERKKISSLTFAHQKQVSMARAILPDPHLLFLNDPFFRLDRSQQKRMRSILNKIQQRGTTLVATAPSLGEFSETASHLCVLTSRRVLAYGPTNRLRASLSCFKMMQVQFESGFRKAIRILNEVDSVHHLSISMSTSNLVRFLFKGTDNQLTELLRNMAQEGATIVSYVEDQEFLGRGGRSLPR